MQLLDTALPVGGFSHSFGLESMVQEGRLSDTTQLKEYIRAMLFHSWAPGDTMAVKAVYVYAPDRDYEAIWLVDRMLHIQRNALETREGLHKMGKRLHRLARSLYPDMDIAPLETAISEQRCFGTHPLVHGWISYQLGVPLYMAAEGYLYCCAAAA